GTGSGAQAQGSSAGFAVSADGRYAVFESEAANLVPGDTNGVADVFARDRETGRTTMLSLAAGGLPANGSSRAPEISADGGTALFVSDASYLVPGDGNGAADAFTVATDAGGAPHAVPQANGGATEVALSPGGHRIAFTSRADNLVGGDTNRIPDVFLHDRPTATFSRSSVSATGAQLVGPDSPRGFGPSLSDNAVVAFSTDAGAPAPHPGSSVPHDGGGSDAFARDVIRRTTVRASVPGGGDSYTGLGSISADGRYLAFWSSSPKLVPGDTNGQDDVFVRDLALRRTVRASLTNGGAQATGGRSSAPALSADGRYVVFVSAAANLVPADTNGQDDVFRRDLRAGTTIRVAAARADGPSSEPVISADGRYIAFTSTATNLVTTSIVTTSPNRAAPNSVPGVFRRDLATGTTIRISVPAESNTDGGADGGADDATGGASRHPSMSADGRYVAFTSAAANLVDGDTNGQDDVFVRDVVAGTTTRVSVASSGGQGTSPSVCLCDPAPSISADGRTVAFVSEFDNLVPGDTNRVADVFVGELGTGVTTRITPRAGGG
ncbi:MAG: hypothetical protein QOD41_821, partial [Cryptosporangiaceae bacterium]|nr:hypothetical protein [Cryptosporangiaceae bacterium]